jgi:hypothetical protein
MACYRDSFTLPLLLVVVPVVVVVVAVVLVVVVVVVAVVVVVVYLVVVTTKFCTIAKFTFRLHIKWIIWERKAKWGIVLKWILEKYAVRIWIGSVWLGMYSCGHILRTQ